MNKAEFIARMAEKYGITKKLATEQTDMFLETLQEILFTNQTVSFHNIFEMGVKVYRERNSVNPNTQERVVIPEHKSPYCKFGEGIKSAVKK